MPGYIHCTTMMVEGELEALYAYIDVGKFVAYVECGIICMLNGVDRTKVVDKVIDIKVKKYWT